MTYTQRYDMVDSGQTHLFISELSKAGHVRCDEGPRVLYQWMIKRWGFDIKDIRSIGGDHVLIERL